MLSKNIYDREKIPKYVKYKEEQRQASHLVKYKKEKEYEYYKCDYCNSNIIIDKDKTKMTGGTATFPATLTKKQDLQLVLCNKCLNPVLKEFEDKLVEENYNHIPRID